MSTGCWATLTQFHARLSLAPYQTATRLFDFIFFHFFVRQPKKQKLFVEIHGENPTWTSRSSTILRTCRVRVEILWFWGGGFKLGSWGHVSFFSMTICFAIPWVAYEPKNTVCDSFLLHCHTLQGHSLHASLLCCNNRRPEHSYEFLSLSDSFRGLHIHVSSWDIDEHVRGNTVHITPKNDGFVMAPACHVSFSLNARNCWSWMITSVNGCPRCRAWHEYMNS